MEKNFNDLKKEAIENVRNALMQYYLVCIQEARNTCLSAMYDTELETPDFIHDDDFAELIDFDSFD